jgi:hypothetical protein
MHIRTADEGGQVPAATRHARQTTDMHTLPSKPSNIWRTFQHQFALALRRRRRIHGFGAAHMTMHAGAATHKHAPGGGVAILLGRKLLLLQLRVGGHAARRVAPRQREHAVVQRVEARQCHELVLVAQLAELLQQIDVDDPSAPSWVRYVRRSFTLNCPRMFDCTLAHGWVGHGRRRYDDRTCGQ